LTQFHIEVSVIYLSWICKSNRCGHVWHCALTIVSGGQINRIRKHGIPLLCPMIGDGEVLYCIYHRCWVITTYVCLLLLQDGFYERVRTVPVPLNQTRWGRGVSMTGERCLTSLASRTRTGTKEHR